jgi:eukaryotic-like serine/threonine-protein kinase
MNEPGSQRLCQRCGQPLAETNELPICDPCALEDALQLADPAVPLPAPPEPRAEPAVPPLGRLGQYELVQLLGRGGMGAVYKARQPGLDRWVAVKVLAAGAFADQTARERLKREAQALAQLQHPGIVEIHEVGEADGLPYFVMTFVDGPNLAELVRDHPLEPRRAARLVARVAEAVQSAHERGILHRDLKPSNVLLGADDRPRITDFGLAVAEWMAQGLTRTGEMLGSPAYLAPEQVSAHRGEVRPASDIYALGAVLYHLLTGRPPFMAATATDTLEQVLRREVLAPRRLNPLVPLELESICLRCLAKQPERRYPTARALAATLDQFVDHPRPFAPVRWLRYHWRQARHDHPARATASLVLLGAILLALPVATVLFWRNLQLNEALVSTQEAALSERALRDQAHRELGSLTYAHQMVAAQRAWEMGDLAAARRWLGRTDPVHRGWEQAYLEALLNRRQLRLKGHLNPISSLAFHPSGDRLVSVGWDLTLRVWSLPEGREEHQLAAHAERPLAVAFSADGQALATGGHDRRVKIWRGNPPELEREFVLHEGRITTVALDPTGARVAAGDTLGFLHVWELATGTLLFKRQGDLKGLSSVAFSPNGQLLASGGEDRSVRLWSVPEGQRLRMLNGHLASIRSLDFSPDGTVLASGADDRMVCLWQVNDGVLSLRLGGHEGPVNTVAYARDGARLASAGVDRTIRLWDPTTGALERVLHGHAGRINSVAFSPDGQVLASGGYDTDVLLWRTDQPPLLRALDGHSLAVNRLAFSPDDRQLLSGSRDGTARLWDLETGQAQQLLATHGARVLAVAFCPDGRWVVTGGTDGRCSVWDLVAGHSPHAFAPELGAVRALTISPDGERAASSHDTGGIQIWKISTAEPMLEIPTSTPRINRLAFGADGTRLYTVGMASTHIEVYDTATSKKSAALRLPEARQTALALCPRGRRIAGGTHIGRVFVMDADSGAILWTVHGHSGAVSQLAWSADGRRLATCGRDGSLRIWDSEFGHEQLAIRHLFDDGLAVAWSHAGRYLAASGRSGRIWLIDLAQR